MDRIPAAYVLLSMRGSTNKNGGTQTNETYVKRIAIVGPASPQDASISSDVSESKCQLERYEENYARAHNTGNTREEVIQVYNQWAFDYDEDMKSCGYNGPEILSEAIASFYPTEKRSQAKVLDVAAGTGQVGEALRKLGFKVLDALEPSPGMLEVLTSKGIYNAKFCNELGLWPVPGILADTYDIIVISGGYAQGHIPVRAFDEMLRIVRPGGMIFIAIREEYVHTVKEYSNGKLEDYIQMLVYKCLWFEVTKKIVNNYIFGGDGVLYVLQKPEI